MRRDTRRKMTVAAATVGSLLLGVNVLVWAAQNPQGNNPQAGQEADQQAGPEQNIPMNQVPQAARAALQKLAHGATFTRFTLEHEHGSTMYEGAWREKGRNVEAAVLADGTLMDQATSISRDEAPPAVRAAIKQKLPDNAQVTYERTTVIHYSAEARVNGRTRELDLLPNGRSAQKDRDMESGANEQAHEGHEERDSEQDED